MRIDVWPASLGTVGWHMGKDLKRVRGMDRDRVQERDELIGVPLSKAARVIGVSQDRLRSWEQIGLVVPRVIGEHGARLFRSYSLEDLVKGCVIRELENRGVHILSIRKAVRDNTSQQFPEPLSQLRWATDRGTAFVIYPDGTCVDGRKAGQTVLRQVIDPEEVRAEARKRVRSRDRDAVGRIRRVRGVHSSRPVFVGTRVTLDAVAAYIERGLPDERILDAFPDLEPPDIDAAREYLATVS